MNKKFTSKKSWFLYLILAFVAFIFLLGFFILVWENPKEMLLAFGFFALVYLLLIYFLRVDYSIDEGELSMRYMFFKRRVPISRIQKMVRGNHLFFIGWKYALSHTGIIIQYGGSQVLVSPRNEEEFIGELLRLNPGIVVTNKTE